jgi:hypothetical protein
MADIQQIKAAILGAAGNPESGVIAELADAMAKAVVDLEAASLERPEKETRVTKPAEKR